MAKKSNKRKSGNGSKKQNKLADCVAKSVNRYLNDLKGEEATRVYQMVVQEVEKSLLQVIMEYTDQNQSKASRVLGINRNTLRKKLDQYGLGA